MKKILLFLLLILGLSFPAMATQTYIDGRIVSGMIRSSVSNYNGLPAVGTASLNDIYIVLKRTGNYKAGLWQKTVTATNTWTLIFPSASTNIVEQLEQYVFATNTRVYSAISQTNQSMKLYVLKFATNSVIKTWTTNNMNSGLTNLHNGILSQTNSIFSTRGHVNKVSNQILDTSTNWFKEQTNTTRAFYVGI